MLCFLIPSVAIIVAILAKKYYKYRQEQKRIWEEEQKVTVSEVYNPPAWDRNYRARNRKFGSGQNFGKNRNYRGNHPIEEAEVPKEVSVENNDKKKK